MGCTSLLLAAIVACFLQAAAAAMELHVGTCYDWSSQLYATLAAKVALDEGYFDDVLPPNASSRAITAVVRSEFTQCDGLVALRLALPWLLGQGTEPGEICSANVTMPPVRAIAGCACSAATMQVSALAASKAVPIVSGSSTNPALSNKELHPYFSRIIPPDDMQASVLAALILEFRWKRIFAVSPAEPYAQGITSAMQAKLSKADVAIIQYQLPWQSLATPDDAKTFDRQLWIRMADQVASETPEPRIFFLATAQNEHIVRIFRDIGLVSSSTLWLQSDGSCSIIGSMTIAASLAAYQAADPGDSWWDYPWNDTAKHLRGMLCTLPQYLGPKFFGNRFRDFFARLTRQKIIAAGWPADEVFLDEWFGLAGWQDDFYMPLYFDTLAVLLLAAGSMLGRGVPSSGVGGDALLAEVRRSRTEGISGMIAFDANGDRLAAYSIKNMRVADGQPILDEVGHYDTAEDRISWSSPPVFADGTTNVPRDRPAPCQPGFSYAGIQRGCTACPPGRYGDDRTSTCEDCEPGSFASSFGMPACQPAPPGTYVAGAASTVLSECPAGTFSAQAGETQCHQCLGGSYQAGTGATSCAICERGYYLSDRACKACGPFETTAGPGATAPDACKLAGGGVGFVVACGFAGTLFCVVLLAVVCNMRRRMKSYEQERERNIQETVREGLLTVQELGHPMIVIRAGDFLELTWKQLGGLHEGLRNSGQLVVLDTLEHVRQAKAAGMRVVFFSYQWLSWERCGPNELQFKWMKTAALNFALTGKASLDLMHVWLDVLAIPQCHPGVKRLAVNSLYTYATAADALIIIAPDAKHFNTGAVANLATYNSRVWTRAEQVAYLSCHDLSCMFIATADDLEPVSEGWLEGIVCIFEAEMTCCRKLHEGTTACDRESLVVPMLGLWYTLCTTVKHQEKLSSEHASGCATLYNLMQPQLDRVFPRTYDFVTRDGRESRTLFGDCVHRVDVLVQRENARRRSSSVDSAKEASVDSAKEEVGSAEAEADMTYSV